VVTPAVRDVVYLAGPTGPQNAPKRYSRINVTTSEMTIELTQPSLFEKKKNMAARFRQDGNLHHDGGGKHRRHARRAPMLESRPYAAER
jgi:hypothetical protein